MFLKKTLKLGARNARGDTLSRRGRKSVEKVSRISMRVESYTYRPDENCPILRRNQSKYSIHTSSERTKYNGHYEYILTNGTLSLRVTDEFDSDSRAFRTTRRVFKVSTRFAFSVFEHLGISRRVGTTDGGREKKRTVVSNFFARVRSRVRLVTRRAERFEHTSHVKRISSFDCDTSRVPTRIFIVHRSFSRFPTRPMI